MKYGKTLGLLTFFALSTCSMALAAETHQVPQILMPKAVVGQMVDIGGRLAADLADMSVMLKAAVGLVPPLPAVDVSLVFVVFAGHGVASSHLVVK